MKKTEKKPREESELSKKIRQHMHDTRKKLGGIDHMLDQMKKPLGEKALEREDDTPEAKKHRRLAMKKLYRIDEAVEHKVGSLIRHGIATAKKNRGRAVIISRNDKIASIDGDTVKTAKGVELKASQKVGSRSNIEKHGDWNVIKEDTISEATTKEIHNVDCPKCGAKAGDRCTHQSGVWKGKTASSWHNERAAVANSKKIKEEAEAIGEVSNKTLRSFADKAKGDEKRSDGIRRALHKLVKDTSIKVPGTKSKWEFKEEASFGSAFAAARSSGQQTFDFGGKSFTTRKAGESDSKWKGSLKPVEAPIPAPRLDRNKLRPGNAGPSGNPANDPKPKAPVSGLSIPKPVSKPAPNAGPSGNPANNPKPISASKPIAKPNAGPSGNPANDPKPIRSASALNSVDSYVKKPAAKTDSGSMAAVNKAADRMRLKIAMDKKFKTEEVLDELSSGTVGRYSRKANDSLAHILPKVLAGDKAAAKKETAREKGIDTADRKLRKHSSANVYATEENEVTDQIDETKIVAGTKVNVTNSRIPQERSKHTVLSVGNNHVKVMQKGNTKPTKFKKERILRANPGRTFEEVELTAEAEKSKEKDHMVNCPSCKGHGKKTDRYDNYDICDDCDGKGKVSAKSLAEKAEQDGVYKAKTAATKKFNNMTGHEHKGITYWNTGDKKSPLTGKHPGKPANGRYKLRVVEAIIAKRMAELDEISYLKARTYRDAARDDFGAMQHVKKNASPDVVKLINHKGKMRVRGMARADDKMGKTNGTYGKVKAVDRPGTYGKTTVHEAAPNWKGDLGPASSDQYGKAVKEHPKHVGTYTHPSHPGDEFHLRSGGEDGGRHVMLNHTKKDIHGGFAGSTKDVHKALTRDFDHFKKVKSVKEDVELEEAAKLIKTHTSADGKKVAKVYRDSEWDEYHVKHYTDGKHHTKADYHTDDKEDAHGTAKHFVKEGVELDEISKKVKDSYLGKSLRQVDTMRAYGVPLDSPKIKKRLGGAFRAMKEDEELEEGKTLKSTEDDGYKSRKNLRDKVKKYAQERREGKSKRQVAEMYPEVRSLNKRKKPSPSAAKLEPTGIM